MLGVHASIWAAHALFSAAAKSLCNYIVASIWCTGVSFHIVLFSLGRMALHTLVLACIYYDRNAYSWAVKMGRIVGPRAMQAIALFALRSCRSTTRFRPLSPFSSCSIVCAYATLNCASLWWEFDYAPAIQVRAFYSAIFHPHASFARFLSASPSSIPIAM